MSASPRHRRKPPFPSHRERPHLLRLTTGFPPTLPLPSPPKLLFNVTIQNSLGPVQVLMSPQESVADLVKAALLIYHREKRRPFLKVTDPNRYALHYSPFCLDSLKSNDKLSDLGSRSFFLCSKPATTYSCSEEANMTTMDSAFPLMMFVHLLL